MAAIHLTDRAGAARPALPLGGISQALAQAVVCALDAPSALGTQPWRWRIGHDWAELDADPGRRGSGPEPDRRLLTISCGAALHHATVALAAAGIGTDVERSSGPAAPHRIAVIRYDRPVDVDARAERMRRAIALRVSDRRTIGASPPTEAQLRLLRAAAAEVGTTLYPLATTLAGQGGAAVIATAGVGPRDWLATGEAISAVLLNAAAEGLATGPVTAASADVPPALARLLPPGAGHPAAVVRFGVANR